MLGGIGIALLKPMPRLGRGLVIEALALGYALSRPLVGDSLKMALDFAQRPPAGRADAGALQDGSTALHEMLGLAWYRLIS